MAFNRLADYFTDVTTTTRKATIINPVCLPHGQSVSSGLLPITNNNVNQLRYSSSLQDLRNYDLEEARSLVVENQPRLLINEGSSSFSKEKVVSGGVWGWVRRKCVGRFFIGVLCVMLVVLVGVLGFRIYGDFFGGGESRFYVVLDCGSTGTRVFVYEAYVDYRKDESLPIGLRSLPEGVRGAEKAANAAGGRAYQRMETEPGFDKLVGNLSGLKAAIDPLVGWAEEQIPRDARKRTSLILYATAGVRRLKKSDSDWLLDNAWIILKNSSFVCKRESVKIISGMEEAYFGWVALNYKLGMLGSVPTKSTFGALDLGGSSLQVTFETNEPVNDETSLKLNIGSVNHHLSAYSLSGYGLNDAFDKSVVHLFRKRTSRDLINGNTKLRHPCLQTGYKDKYICSQCVLEDSGSPLIGGKSIDTRGKPGVEVELLGSPNWEECCKLAKVSVNLSEWSASSPGIDCEVQPCALSKNLPRPKGQFNAMSGFFVVFRFFNLTSKATLDDVLHKGQEFCEKQWDVAKHSVVPQPFIEQYCFRAPYIVSLLREGLHIVDKQVVVGSGSITWTLGVALLEAGGKLSMGMELHNYRVFQMEKSTFFFVALSMSLVLLLCALSCVRSRIQRFLGRPYLPLFRPNSAATTSVLKLQRWSPISSGDGRTKMPLSPTVAGSQQRPFSMGHGLGGSSIQLMESTLHHSTGSVSHSYSSGSLGQMQFENDGMGSFWAPNRSQMRLQSRRSQSREDLNSSIAESHMAKV